MIWVGVGILVWVLIGLLLALLVCKGIGRRDRQIPYDLRQCPERLEDGRRCKWYRTHPPEWGHQGWR